jgi:hypothetical protein
MALEAFEKSAFKRRKFMEENQEKRRHRRQRERVALFRIAQGRVPWYCQKATLIVVALIGCLFLVLGIFLEVQAISRTDGSRLESMVLGMGSGVGGLILLLETLVVLPRGLQRLPAASALFLKTSFLIEEHTGGRVIEDDSQGDNAEKKPGNRSEHLQNSSPQDDQIGN